MKEPYGQEIVPTERCHLCRCNGAANCPLHRPLPPERWDTDNSRTIDSPAEVEAFLDEYEALCRKHGLSLGHEDSHGSFYVEKPIDGNIKWVRDAILKLGKDPGAPKIKLPPAPWEVK